MALISCAKTPETGYKKFYRQYRNTTNTISFKIPGGLASMFIDNEDKELKDFMKNIDDISFFIANKTTNQIIIDLNENTPQNLYKEIMVIHNENTGIIFLVRDNGETINEILMTVYEPDELIIMCIYGEFTREDARKIVKAIDTKSAIKIGG